MDWNKGYSATYYIAVVDKVTWKDLERYEIVSGSIARSIDGLMESADLQCVNYSPEGEQIIRVWMYARQEGDSAQIPLFTGLTSSPTREINGTRVEYPVQCYSVLKIADDVLLRRGYYAPAGAVGADTAEELLDVAGIPVTKVSGSPRLLTDIIAEDGETHLSMAHKVLDAIGWQMRTDGNGEVTIEPYEDDYIATFDARFNDMIEPSLSVEYDWYNCPNVFVAISGDLCAIARDEDPSSPYSIQNRGREVWKEESNVKLSDGETIESYAERRLKELQQVATKIKYDRRYDPDIRVNDVVRLNYPAHDIVGEFMVVSQSIELGYSARTSEEVVQV